MSDGFYTIELEGVLDSVRLVYENDVKKRVFFLDFGLKSGEVLVDVVDGEYKNLLTEEVVVVRDGKVLLTSEPIIFDVNKPYKC